MRTHTAENIWAAKIAGEIALDAMGWGYNVDWIWEGPDADRAKSIIEHDAADYPPDELLYCEVCGVELRDADRAHPLARVDFRPSSANVWVDGLGRNRGGREHLRDDAHEWASKVATHWNGSL